MHFPINRPLGWALVFLTYGALALLASWLSGATVVPGLVRNLLTAFAAPLLILEFPLDPLLRRLNLVVTAYWSYPKTSGLILVVIFWAVVIFSLGMLFRKSPRP